MSNTTIVGQGIAGTPRGGVVSIQGIVGGTPIPIGGDPTSTPPINQQIGAEGSKIVNAAGDVRTILGSYYIGTPSVAGAIGARKFFSIENPVGSGVIILVHRFETVSNAGAGSSNGPISLGRTTATPTLGTVETPQKRRSADPASLAIIRTLPTAIAAAGAMARSFLNSVNGQTTRDELIGHHSVYNAIELQEGEAILTSATDPTNGQNLIANIEWFEVS
jgi:hypothetical protein